MAKGAEAKIDVANRIAKAFGSDWIGEQDKKYYVWGTEKGEKIQICISMTCPSKPIEVNTFDEEVGDLDFENMPPKPISQPKAEITPEEQKTVEDLMARLGL